MLFGAGWALSGACPAVALVQLGEGHGAALFTTLSFTLAQGRGDPARVAAQILPGVGFIGAGTILHTRGSVTGLTSAATIWVVAAIGMALGAAAYMEALGATFLVVAVLQGLRQVERLVGRASAHTHLLIHARPEPTALEELESLVRRAGLEIERASSRHENADLVKAVDAFIDKCAPPEAFVQAIVAGVRGLPGSRRLTGARVEPDPDPEVILRGLIL